MIASIDWKIQTISRQQMEEHITVNFMKHRKSKKDRKVYHFFVSPQNIK
jgi:hypothetical protein